MKCNSTICLAILYNKPTKTEDPGPILKMIIILVHQQVLTLVCGCQCAVAHDYLNNKKVRTQDLENEI